MSARDARNFLDQAKDLLDIAAIQTFINGGEVYVVEPHELPDPGMVAAVFRY